MADRPSRWPRYTRDVDGAWLAIEDLRDVVDGIATQGRIEQAVTAALEAHDARGEVRSATVFDRREKRVVILIAVIAILPSAASLILHLLSV